MQQRSPPLLFNRSTRHAAAQVEHCCDGVACLKLLDALHPGKVSFKKVGLGCRCRSNRWTVPAAATACDRSHLWFALLTWCAAKVNMAAKFPEERVKNLKIVQKVQAAPPHSRAAMEFDVVSQIFSSVGVAMPCSIEKISKGQFQDNYDMLQVLPPLLPPPPPPLSIIPPPFSLQFCYQHANRIHPSTDFAAPPRPSSAAAAPQRAPAASFAEVGSGKGVKVLGRAPQGRNVAWNRWRVACCQ
jgi:hypothetical protein